MSRLSDFIDRIPYFTTQRNIPIEDLRANAIVATGFGEPADLPRSYGSAADAGYRNNELVFACIQEYITSASEAKLVVGNRDADGVLVPTTNARALELTAAPNPAMDIVAFLEALHMMLLIGGNVYLFKPPSSIGTVSNLFLLRPDRVRVIPNQATGAAAGWKYTVGNSVYTLPAEVISQHKTTDPLNDWYGLGPLQVLAKQVNLDTSATDFARSTFDNKGVPAGFLKVARKINNQDEADAIRKNWKARFAGKANWQQIGVLDEDADYKQIASNMADMGMPELRDLTESRICSVFGIPPIVVGANVGLKQATYSNYAQAKESMWEETLLPAYKRVAAFLTRALKDTPDFRGMEFAFDFSEVRALAEDQKEQADIIKVKADTASILIRAGYEADSVSDVLQLPEGLVHTGLVPTTVQGESLAEVGAPPAKALTPVRGLKDLEKVIDQEYDNSIDSLEATIQKSFNKLGRSADSILGTAIQMDEVTPVAVKASPTFGIDGSTLIPFTYDDVLAKEILPELQSVAENTWKDVTRSGVLTEITYSSHEGAVLTRLTAASQRATQMNDFTRARINTALQEGVNRGYSLRQIADGVPKEKFNGLRNIVRGIPSNPDAVKRARTIARTEVRWAQNQTTALRYKASGVAEVIIRDGDDDPECAAVDGTRQTIEWYEDNPTQHPNCTRGATPVTEGLLE
jgi:HK97 family phage portal protein